MPARPDKVSAATRDLDAEEAAFRVAAVREIFEEAGVLLARPIGSGEFVAQDVVDDLVARFRAPLEKNEKDIADLIAAAEPESGKATLVFATKMNLRLLAESATVDEALAAAAERRIVCVEPEVTEVEGGFRLRIPAEAGYGLTEDFVRAEDRAMSHVPRERS